MMWRRTLIGLAAVIWAVGATAGASADPPAPSVTVTATATTATVNYSTSGADQVKISRSAGSCVAATTPIPGPSGSYADPVALVAATAYCYRVTAIDTTPITGGSTWTDVTVPAAPAITAPVAGSVFRPGTSVPLTASGTSPTFQSVPPSAFTGSTWTVPNTDATYQVSAKITVGTVTRTGDAIALIADGTPPPAPALAPGTQSVASAPTFTWGAVADPHGPVLYQLRELTLGGTRTVGQTTLTTLSDTSVIADGTHSYNLIAFDAPGNASAVSNTVTAVVDSSGTSTPRTVMATTPTNVRPKLSWTQPLFFVARKWQVFRDDLTAPIAVIAVAEQTSFSDDSLTVEGPHRYWIRALGDNDAPGSLSPPLTVVYDAQPPALADFAAAVSAAGTIDLAWPAATDPEPSSGIAQYVVRRGDSAPLTADAGSAVCQPKPPATGCTDAKAISGQLYGYALFAIDGAGNTTRRTVIARPVDTVKPSPPSSVKGTGASRSARITWTAPPLTGDNADRQGFLIVRLRSLTVKPKSPDDGELVCPAGPTDTECFISQLKNNEPVAFAVFAFDEVPNYSTPVIVKVTPHRTDRAAPHAPLKLRSIVRGHQVVLYWKTPTDGDLKEFVVRWLPNRYPPGVKVGKFAFRGRKLAIKIGLKAGSTAYFCVFATDVNGNVSRPARIRVVVPGAVRKKVVAKKTTSPVTKAPVTKAPVTKAPVTKAPVTKTPATPATPKKPKAPSTPPPVIVITG